MAEMTSALLCLMILCTPATIVAHEEWDRLSWAYNLPPLSLSWENVGGGGIAAQRDFDPQGRASVAFDWSMEGASLATIRKTTAHEAVHTMLRHLGVQYGGLAEERFANNFAYCWAGVPDYVPERPCAKVLAELPSRYRDHGVNHVTPNDNN